MRLEVTGRHVAVTPALKTFARTKLSKLEKLLGGPLDFHVILTVEKHRHIAEIVAHGRSTKLSAKEVTQDMYTSIGECIDKLETQARKHKEKFAARRRRGSREAAPKEEPSGEPTRSSNAGQATASKRKRRPSSGRSDGVPRIVQSDVFPRKPMTVEEAALQVGDSDLGFFVFRNSRSQEINVLYKLKDGSLGLVEPES
jgi:putative sigma-54 modulation protein